MDNFTCSACNKTFMAYRSLQRHANEKHPEIRDVIAPHLRKVKTFSHSCDICGANFNSDKNFNQHLKSHTSVVPNEYWKCPLCDKKSSKTIILQHLQSDHELSLDIETLNFSTFDDFQNWKKSIEKDSMSAYLVQRGVFRKRDGTEKHSFYCHRSGHFISKSKGIRCMKAQGSKKINAYCPSNMQVEVSPDGSCSVQYLRKHVGHTNDLFLTNEEREHLALKMAEPNLEIDFSKADHESECATILSSFNKSDNFVGFSLDEEKQKVKFELNHLIDSITSREQLDVFKKMLLSAKPTIKALEHPDVSSCTFPTLCAIASSNKNIVPQTSYTSSKKSHSKSMPSISKPTPEEAQKITISLLHSDDKGDI
ncbi:uncharacterized protein [Parasteatoda tepidariorum]|uniref:uncharacterized protein n=1 Tax=Parasteatoda tepidariorum TaxID=114398 RepID=UPI0039BC495F